MCKISVIKRADIIVMFESFCRWTGTILQVRDVVSCGRGKRLNVHHFGNGQQLAKRHTSNVITLRRHQSRMCGQQASS
jgi:hypothetical protein